MIGAALGLFLSDYPSRRDTNAISPQAPGEGETSSHFEDRVYARTPLQETDTPPITYGL